MPKKINLDANFITKLYEEEVPVVEIAKMFGVAETTIIKRIKEVRGSMRTFKEASEIREKLGRRPNNYFWLGKKQPPEMVKKRTEKTTGAGNGRYKDGSQARQYRNVINKEHCSKCGTKENLAIHHIDFDHYNNKIDNLEVLCCSCHASLHTTARWKRASGIEGIPVSNAPVNWDK